MNLFVDSGAFSAYNSGTEIDLEKYIDWIKENDFQIYANLDVIGDWEGSLRNQKQMEEAGLTPIPCFHVGEPLELLEEYVQEYDYIALGGMQSVGANTQARDKWFNMCFGIICDEEGNPRTKVHGFGMTAFVLVRCYPWYSVDSSSWNMGAINGSIYLPDLSRTKPNFEILRAFSISERSPNKRGLGRHYTTLSDLEKTKINQFIKINGSQLENLSSGEDVGYRSRLEWNIKMISEFVETLPTWPWCWKKKRGLLI